MADTMFENSSPADVEPLEVERRDRKGTLAQPAGLRWNGGIYRILLIIPLTWSVYYAYPLFIKIRDCLLLGNRPGWCLGESPFIQRQVIETGIYGFALPLAGLLLIQLSRWIGAGFK